MAYKPTSFLTDPADEQADYLAATTPTGPKYVAPDPNAAAPDPDLDPNAYNPVTPAAPPPAPIIQPSAPPPPPPYLDPDLNPNAYAPVNPTGTGAPPASYSDPDLDPNAYSPANPNAGVAAKYRQKEADLLAQRPEDKAPGAWRTIGAIGAGIATGYLTRDRGMVHNVEDRIMHPGAAAVQRWASDVNDAELRAQQAEKIDADAKAAAQGTAGLAHTQSETGYQNALAQNMGRPDAPKPATETVEVTQPDGTKKTEIHYFPNPMNTNIFSVLGTPPSVEKQQGDADMRLGIEAWKRLPENQGKEPSLNDLKSIHAVFAATPGEKSDYQLAYETTDPKLPPDQRADLALKRVVKDRLATRPITNNNFNNMPLPGLPTGQETPEQKAETGDAYLSRLSPSLAAQVKQVAMGGLTMPPASARSNAAIQLREAVMHYDPQMSEQRAQIRKAFTTGTDGRNIGNLNTAAAHLDALGELAKAMDNGSLKVGNTLYNYVSSQLGGAAPTNYEGLRQAVAGEMDAALHGSSTIPGRDAIAATMPANAAPGQMSGIVKTNLSTIAQKLNTQKERYEQQIPGDTVWSPVLPSAKAVFDKYGVNPIPAAGGGNSAGAPTYKFTGTGPNGHKLGSNGGPWVDIQTGKAVQ